MNQVYQTFFSCTFTYIIFTHTKTPPDHRSKIEEQFLRTVGWICTLEPFNHLVEWFQHIYVLAKAICIVYIKILQASNTEIWQFPCYWICVTHVKPKMQWNFRNFQTWQMFVELSSIRNENICAIVNWIVIGLLPEIIIYGELEFK